MVQKFDFRQNKQLVLVLSSIAFEYYLFTLFIFLAPSISHVLFPLLAPEMSEWFALSIFLIAGFCRPLGSLLFSGIGDGELRHRVFFWATFIMSITCIGLSILPSSHAIGFLSPLLLIGIRMSQGIVVGAAIPEAMIFCYERASKGMKVLASNFVNIAVSFGFLGAIVFALLTHHLFGENTWRAGVAICGFINLLIAYLLRNSFAKQIQFKPINYQPLKIILKNHKLDLLRLICFASFLTSGTAVFFYIMPSYLHDYFNYSDFTARLSCIISIGGYILGQIVASFLHQKVGKNFYISSGFFFKALLVFVFHTYITHNLIEVICLNTLCCFIFGFFIAKLPVLMINSFPASSRYAGVGLVYNISFGVMFGISHYAVSFLIQLTRSLYMPSMYIVFFSYLSLISLWFMSKTSFIRYRN